MVFAGLPFESIDLSSLFDDKEGIEIVYEFVDIKHPAEDEIIKASGKTITRSNGVVGH